MADDTYRQLALAERRTLRALFDAGLDEHHPAVVVTATRWKALERTSSRAHQAELGGGASGWTMFSREDEDFQKWLGKL